MRRLTLGTILVAVVLDAPAAFAQPTEGAPSASTGEILIGSDSGASVRSELKNWLVAPSGTLVVGATFAFVTSDAGLGPGAEDDELKFTDVAMINPSARYSFTDSFEIAGGVGVLVKQPPDLDESILQSASLGGRLSVGDASAVFLNTGGGALLADLGLWGTAAAGFQHRLVPDRLLTFDLRAGASGLALSRDDLDATQWLGEVFVGGEALMHDPHGNVGVWAGIDVAFPVVHDPDDATFDPQTRVGFHAGAALGIVKDLDLFALGSIIDRGDVDSAGTTLPILAGGFDQVQIIFGVMKRFDLGEDETSRSMMFQAL